MLRGEKKPGSKWTYKDRIIAMSLTVYEQGICKGCGQPLTHTTGDDPHLYEVELLECSGCKELEEYKGSPGPGQRTYLVPEG